MNMKVIVEFRGIGKVYALLRRWGILRVLLFRLAPLRVLGAELAIALKDGHGVYPVPEGTDPLAFIQEQGLPGNVYVFEVPGGPVVVNLAEALPVALHRLGVPAAQIPELMARFSSGRREPTFMEWK